MRVLAFDPGKSQKSFAYSFVVDGTVERYGMVQTLTTLKPPEFKQEVEDFCTRIENLVLRLKPDVIVAERFMDRGGASKGSTGEFINVMLGLIAARVPGGLELVMPATWKGWLARTYLTGKPTKRQRTAVPNMWAHLRSRFPDLCWPKDKTKRMIIHEADACGIALWRYETHFKGERRGSIDSLVDRRTVKIIV